MPKKHLGKMRVIVMSKKELRINEIMSQQKVDEDVAELLFQDELSKMFPECDPEDTDTLEMMFETVS